jgi:hypothetical protein
LVCQPITARIDYFQTFHGSTIYVVKIVDLSVARLWVEKAVVESALEITGCYRSEVQLVGITALGAFWEVRTKTAKRDG